MASLVDVMSEDVVNSFLDGALHVIGSLVRWDLHERFQSFDDAHVAGVFSPTLLEPIVRPSSRTLFYSVVKPLVLDDPSDSSLNSAIV